MTFVMEFAFKLGYMFPYPESEPNSSLKTLKSAGYTCSCMKGVMEALTFCRFVFGIEELRKSVPGEDLAEGASFWYTFLTPFWGPETIVIFKRNYVEAYVLAKSDTRQAEQKL